MSIAGINKVVSHRINNGQKDIFHSHGRPRSWGDQGALKRKSGLQNQFFLCDILPSTCLHFFKCNIKPEKRPKERRRLKILASFFFVLCHKTHASPKAPVAVLFQRTQRVVTRVPLVKTGQPRKRRKRNEREEGPFCCCFFIIKKPQGEAHKTPRTREFVEMRNFLFF